MRILFLDWSPLITYGIAPGFKELGFNTVIVRPEENSIEGINRKIKDFKPDLLFTEALYGRDDIIFPVIEQAKIPHICWAIEDPVSIEFSLKWAKESILTLTTCEEWVSSVYEANGHKAISIPFACNLKFHRKGSPSSSLAHDLVFVGNNYKYFPTRLEGYQTILNPFISNGYDIAVYGNWWWEDLDFPYQIPRNIYLGYLDYEKFPDLCASANFILGVHSIGGSKTMQSMRTFDVLGCAGFYLTHKTAAIENMFENHKHLVWSSSPEETMDLYKHYKKHPERMEQIRMQGQKFVFENHTYAHRVRQIIHALGEIL